jgi:pimeloyl-ACP methyl ester carboxylesterase
VFTTTTLRDGRSLEYADLGDPDGTPVLFLPGTPGAAGQGAIVADAARSAGVRLLAVSRPGYAGSTNSPPGLTSTASDVVELADQVGLGRFVTMGCSGGGPYALALAAHAPDRVTSVAVLGGIADSREVSPEELDAEDRRAIELLGAGDVQGAAAILEAWSQKNFGALQHLSPEDFHTEMQRTKPPGESWLEERPESEAHFEADFQRALTTFDGFVRDNLSWLGAWDFELSAVRTPVRLVYGEGDRMVPTAHGEWLHARLADSELDVIPGGHGDATFGAAERLLAHLAST